MNAYQLSDIVQQFDGRTILEIDSFNIESSAVVALLGPNGAGKTTLLNILGLLTKPVSGEVRFFGDRVIFREALLQDYRKQVVLVSQNPILFTTTVFKNMEFGLKLRQFSQKQRFKIIEESLDLVGMRHMMQARAHKLSGGETQRVAIARALALAPQVLLCDEPTACVDLEHQSVVIDLLRQVNLEKKITVIFTSHDRIQATSLAQRVIFLDNGRVSAAPYDNMFSATVLNEPGHPPRCNIYDRHQLIMNDAKTGEAKVIIDPLKIAINQPPDRAIPNNTMHGKVVQITEEYDTVRLIVDSSVRLCLLI